MLPPLGELSPSAVSGYSKLSCKATCSFFKEIFGNNESVVNSSFDRQIKVLPI
jgi:hypothetical protein